MTQVALNMKDFTNEPKSDHASVQGPEQEVNQLSCDSDLRQLNAAEAPVHSTLSPPDDVPDTSGNDESGGKLENTSKKILRRKNWTTASEFVDQITVAARNALLSKRRSFTKVVAVITYWETATGLSYLRTQADELGRLFKESFMFEVLIYKIPDNHTDHEFITKIGAELLKVANDPNSLFILYYGGHATFDRLDNMRLWKKDNFPGTPEIAWSTAMWALFRTGATCCKVFLFDCCHAGAMIDHKLKWETSCELLGACAADVEASGLKVSSFTEALRNELSKNTYDVSELRSVLCSTEKQEEYSLIRYPHYQDAMGIRGECNSVVITKLGSPEKPVDRPQSPAEILERIRNMTDAVMCVGVTFKCDAKAFMDEIEDIKNHWRWWFISAPSESEMVIVRACQGTRLINAWNSKSCFTQWLLPLWLWDAMEPPSNYHGIKIIHPQDYASDIQNIFAESDCSSDLLAGEATPSLCPSPSDGHSSIQGTILEGMTGEKVFPDQDP